MPQQLNIPACDVGKGENMHSYTGRIMRIDVSKNRISEENLNEKDAEKFIGGKGLGAKLLFDNVDITVDPLSPDNILILCTRPLTGSSAPTGGRWCIFTKSPLTSLLSMQEYQCLFELHYHSFGLHVVESTEDAPSMKGG